MLAGANKRRLELLAKELNGGRLMRMERKELVALQDEFLAELETFPLPAAEEWTFDKGD